MEPPLTPPPLRGANILRLAIHSTRRGSLRTLRTYAEIPLPCAGEGETGKGASSVPHAAPCAREGESEAARERILTVGHSNHTAERLVELLQQHGVQVVVDVRSQPYSRFAPQFNRENLQPVVTGAGLQYLFMGEELGGRQLGRIEENRDRKAAYARVAALPAFQRGIERVVSGSATYQIALLCAEEDPTECHRRVWVTRALRERGADVWHVRGDGHLDADDRLGDIGVQLGLF